MGLCSKNSMLDAQALRVENPRVGGSIPPLGTIDSKPRNCEVFLFLAPPNHDFTSRRREIYFA